MHHENEIRENNCSGVAYSNILYKTDNKDIISYKIYEEKECVYRIWLKNIGKCLPQHGQDFPSRCSCAVLSTRAVPFTLILNLFSKLHRFTHTFMHNRFPFYKVHFKPAFWDTGCEKRTRRATKSKRRSCRKSGRLSGEQVSVLRYQNYTSGVTGD